jgi:hypothetical protein
MVYLGYLIIYACFKYCVSSEINSISDIAYTGHNNEFNATLCWWDTDDNTLMSSASFRGKR